MKLTVEEAIRQGRLVIHGTTMLILAGSSISSFILVANKILPFWIIPSSILYAPLLAWIFYNLVAKKWTFWAFRKVEDLHELKRRAIEENFVYANDKKFNNSEMFYSKRNKMEWDSVLERIKKTPIFVDDYSIQPEEKIYYTRDLKNKANSTPQIILNQEGIDTIFTGFYKWSEIKNEQVITQQTLRGPISYFYYDHPKGSRLVNIDRFNIGRDRFSRLLKIYKGRNESKSNIR